MYIYQFLNFSHSDPYLSIFNLHVPPPFIVSQWTFKLSSLFFTLKIICDYSVFIFIYFDLP